MEILSKISNSDSFNTFQQKMNVAIGTVDTVINEFFVNCKVNNSFTIQKEENIQIVITPNSIDAGNIANTSNNVNTYIQPNGIVMINSITGTTKVT